MRPRSATRAARALPLDSCGKCHVQTSVNRRNGHRNFALCGLPVIDMRVKQFFFDKAKVIRAVDKARRAVLSKAGAFIRTTARRSLRRRKGPAPPGQPPHSHTGLLKRFLFFAYEPASDSVVIGPARLNKPGAAPRVLEHGGKTMVQQRRRGRIVRRGCRSRRGRSWARHWRRNDRSCRSCGPAACAEGKSVANAKGIRAGKAFVELGVSDKLTAGLRRAQKRLQAFGAGLRSIGTRITAFRGVARRAAGGQRQGVLVRRVTNSTR
jgi:hypothetical protein